MNSGNAGLTLEQFYRQKGFDCAFCKIPFDATDKKKNPTLLPCQHNACIECIEKSGKALQQCPTCFVPIAFSAQLGIPNQQMLSMMGMASELWTMIHSAKMGESMSKAARIEVPKEKTAPRNFDSGMITKQSLEHEMYANQKEIIEHLCYTGQPVSITEYSSRKICKIVNYVKAFPTGQKPGNYLFTIAEGSTEVIRMEWNVISEISWVKNSSIKPEKPFTDIYRYVANALTLPQTDGATAALIKQMAQTEMKLADVCAALDYDFSTMLMCRFINEYIRTNELDKAREIYQYMHVNKITPISGLVGFDFPYTILNLVKMGIITDKLKPEMSAPSSRDNYGDRDAVHYAPREMDVDFERGFGYAMRESQHYNLRYLIQFRSITAEDIKNIKELREDPRVNALCERLGFKEKYKEWFE